MNPENSNQVGYQGLIIKKLIKLLNASALLGQLRYISIALTGTGNYRMAIGLSVSASILADMVVSFAITGVT